jgi:hypothetical protein
MPYDKFNIIKFKGDPNTVTLVDGTKIQNDRSDFIFVPEYGAMIRKAPYGNEFLFEVPKRIRGPSYLCSCGSVAIFIGSNAYGHLGSPEGLMLVCEHHTTYNRHADGAQ